MAVFISVETDPFEEVRRQAAESRNEPQINVRRPLRGLQIKDDTYAVLKVLNSQGEELPLVDSSSPFTLDGTGTSLNGVSNFIVQQLSEQRMEKQQIVETFGEDYIFFFGERPRFINVSGVLLNTADFNWKSEFWHNYDNFLRGTKLVENNARLYLYFDDVVVEGYVVMASAEMNAMTPYHLPFQFQMFVCNYAILSTVGSIFFQQDAENVDVIPSNGVPPDDSVAQANQAQLAALQGAGGGLLGFLSASSQFLSDASFSIQSTLENIANTFYGRQLVVPEGIGNQLVVPNIQNKASFKPAPINQEIFKMWDEYIERAPEDVRFDDAELRRVQQEQRLRSPDALERKARAELERLGVDTTRRETEYLLLGRAAFAGLQTFGSFGIRQADGVLANPLNV